MTDVIIPRHEMHPIPSGIDLHVLRWAPPVHVGDIERTWVLTHGLASNARLWDGVARRLAEAGHRVVTVDQRGHGQSSKPDDGYDVAPAPTTSPCSSTRSSSTAQPSPDSRGVATSCSSSATATPTRSTR